MLTLSLVHNPTSNKMYVKAESKTKICLVEHQINMTDIDIINNFLISAQIAIYQILPKE